MKPKFSIIIPVYNLSPFIAETLNSIKNQSFASFEVIIVDDNSTDNTRQIIAKFCDNDPRFILLVQKKNYGVSVARNRGIKNANGEFIEFIDGDDQLKKDALAQINDKIFDDIDAVAINYQITDDKHTILKPNAINAKELKFPDSSTISGYESLKKLFEGLLSHITFSIVVRRRLLFERGIAFPEGRNFGEDFATTYKILFYSNKVAFVNDRIYFYIQHNGSATHVKKLNNSADYFQSVNEINDFILINAPELKELSDLFTIKRLLNAYCNMISFPCSLQNKQLKFKIYTEIFNKKNYSRYIPENLSNKDKFKLWLLSFGLLDFVYFIKIMWEKF